MQPTRPDVTQAQRRLQLERVLDWLNAIAVTVGRVGYRFEWRLSPMPVRWRPDDRGVAFDINDYMTPHSWVPLGQLYGVPPPTDRPLAFADYVYPPYSVDKAFAEYFASCVRAWAHFHNSQVRLARRRELYASRRRLFAAPLAGECVVLCCTQEHWELREVTAHCLRWVNSRCPPVEPIALPRSEALPELLHPCGVWGDVLESPTEREEMGPSESWPPPDMDSIDPPPNVTMVFPAVRDPAGREASTVVPSRQQEGPPAPRQRPTAEERRKRSRAVPAGPAAPQVEEPSTPSAVAPKAPPVPPRAVAEQPQVVSEETQAPAVPAAPQQAALLETRLARALTGECLCSVFPSLLLCSL